MFPKPQPKKADEAQPERLPEVADQPIPVEFPVAPTSPTQPDETRHGGEEAEPINPDVIRRIFQPAQPVEPQPETPAEPEQPGEGEEEDPDVVIRRQRRFGKKHAEASSDEA